MYTEIQWSCYQMPVIKGFSKKKIEISKSHEIQFKRQGFISARLYLFIC